MTPQQPPRDELLVRLAELLEVFEPLTPCHCDVPDCMHRAVVAPVAA